MSELIEKYIDKVLKNPKIEDDQLFDNLINLGYPNDLVYNIVVFLPILFNRIYFKNTGLNFPEYYQEVKSGKVSSDKIL